MDTLSQQAQLLIQEHGIAGYFGAACMFILIAAIYISIFLAIGMLIYSIFSKNWRVWEKWKYIGFLVLFGIGLLVIGVIVKIITGIINTI